jgi:dienelactone hydrolase
MNQRQKRKTKKALIVIMALTLVTFFWSGALLYYRALAVLLRNVSPEHPSWIAKLATYAVDEEEREVSLPTGVIRARLYRPKGCENPPGLVLVHGIHHLGMNEPRNVSFARALASAGVLVLTPEMAELTDYRVEPSTIRDISACAEYMVSITGRTTTGVVGISFAGGLALLAAADPHYQKPIGFVVAVGSHHDLTRVLHFYAGDTVRGPDGTPYPIHPHPYGARVLIYSYLNELFSAQDLPMAHEALRAYLYDQHGQAKILAQQLSEDGKKIMLQLLDERDNTLVHRFLMLLLAEHESKLQNVSPHGRLARLKAQVLLIHGADDPVVPATETPWLAREIPQRLLRQSLVSPVLRHAEIEQKPTIKEYVKLVDFVADLLALTYKEPKKKR